MKTANLSEYFAAVAAKRLSAVETRPQTSNQHEFNGAYEIRDRGGGKERCGLIKGMFLQTDGTETGVEEGSLREKLLKRYGTVFPPAAEFSRFARETRKGVGELEDPEGALMVWMEQEE